MSVLTPELLSSFDASVKPVNESRLLPPVLYTSDEFYEFERDAIFGRDWLCVGRADEIPNPGDYLTITIADEPLLVTRMRDGGISVMSNVCRHRGMVLAEGRGNVKSFLCQYHHWVYGTDGRLIGCPEMDRAAGFDKNDVALPSFKVEVWNGFVFTSFDPQAPPLAPSLAKAGGFLRNYHLDEAVTVDGGELCDLRWNWKVMLENFNDPYHASRLHGSLQTFAPSDMNDFPEWDDADNAIFRVQHFTHPDGSFNPSQRALLPVFPHLTDEDRRRGSFMLLPPTLGLAVVPDQVAYFIISPRGPGVIDIRIGYCLDRSAVEHPLFEYLFQQAKDGVNNFNVQDVHADEQVQKGLRSRFAPRGRYSWQEEPLRQFNRWLVSRYRRHWPQPPGGDGGAAGAHPRAAR
jgi:phenylpropionate dioxygenase-like ring-hydroxylating dioxygenase large terminal subunit